MNRKTSILLALVAICLIVSPARTQAPNAAPHNDSPARFIYPLTAGPERKAPPIRLDLTEVPDDAVVAAWAAEAKKVCEDWYPLICRFLATEEWKTPAEIEIQFKRVQDLPGWLPDCCCVSGVDRRTL